MFGWDENKEDGRNLLMKKQGGCKESMNEEMKSLQKNSTWKVVELLEGKKLVGCRWVFTVKYKVDGTTEQFKARLVTNGSNLWN